MDEIQANPDPDTIRVLIGRHICSVRGMYGQEPVLVAVLVPQLIEPAQTLLVLRICEVLKELIGRTDVGERAQLCMETITGSPVSSRGTWGQIH